MRASAPLLLFSDPKSAELVRRTWTLAVIEGSDRGARGDIDHSPALLGAAPTSAIVLSDDTVSRFHAELEPFAEGVRLRDLDSTNGTFIDDKRIHDAFLEDGATFRLGHTTIQIFAHDEVASEVPTDPRGVAPGAIETIAGAIAVGGKSREVLRLIDRIAPSRSSVLLLGEHGVGKGRLARVLHARSRRASGPLIRIHARDVAEGGIQEKIGDANGGTLFIEDIGLLSDHAQAELLSAIENDVRFVSSTSTNLDNDPRFWPTLLRRIGVIRLRIPPLSERREDLIPLAEHFFFEQFGDRLTIGPRARVVLERAPFPGNLDQLRTAVLVLHATEGQLEDRMENDALIANLRMAHVSDVVERWRGNVTRAAAELLMSPVALFRFCQRHDIDLERG